MKRIQFLYEQKRRYDTIYCFLAKTMDDMKDAISAFHKENINQVFFPSRTRAGHKISFACTPEKMNNALLNMKLVRGQ